jgi:hypothetical protein
MEALLKLLMEALLQVEKCGDAAGYFLFLLFGALHQGTYYDRFCRGVRTKNLQRIQ